MKIRSALPFFLVLSAALLSRCGNGPAADPEFTAPIPAKESAKPSTRFVRLDPEKIGIDFVQHFKENYQYSFIVDPSVYNGGGVAVIDIDNDQLQDLFFVSRQMECKLYRNRGDLTFEDVTEKAGVACRQGLKTGASVVDINGDGFQDLYVCRTGLKPTPDRANLLFINNGNGTFTEQAAAYGLNDISASQHANFFDYDLDGDLDVYILNQPSDNENIQNADFIPAPGKTVSQQAPRTEHDTDRLYRNNGDGTFSNVSEQAGIRNRAWGLSVTVSDLTNDGYPDVYIGNDFIMPDFLYVNQRNGTFKEQGMSSFRHMSNHTMGVDLADINNDALLDVMALDMLAEPWDRRKKLMTTMVNQRYNMLLSKGYGHQVMRNTLQINNGNGSYSEIGCLAGMFATDWSWAVLAADFDNDGWKDLFVSNGIFRDLNDLDFQNYTIDSINRTGGVHPGRFPDFNDFSQLMPSQKVRNYMYRNTGQLQLNDVSEDWGFTDLGYGNGAAYVDLDNDGDLDLVVNNAEDPSAVYENQAEKHNNNHWLQVKLKGTKQNPAGVGAKIRAYFGNQVYYQEMTPIRGFFSSVEPIFQIGVGDQTQIDRIELEWQEGKHQILQNIPTNQRLVLDIADAANGKLPNTPPDEKPILRAVNPGLDFVHRENLYEDFDRERLLPHRYSTLGPALASGDLNGDGLDDLFIGGALDQPSAVYLQQNSGRFARADQPALAADARFEDVAALFFDADNDGDLDLYVVSGGNEVKAFEEHYKDRLYLNDGKGRLAPAENALPRETASGGSVTAVDYDEDGDLDLFVGGRITPGAYPQPSQSMVLRNDGGKFHDVTRSVAPDLRYLGMVSDIRFGDLDGDGRLEMVVVGDWMPVHVFRWSDGQFVLSTEQVGLADYKGWWNCVHLADLDGDGDLDIVAGNEGLNTRFRPTPEAPLRVYARDFDQNGSIDPVMAVAHQGHYIPVPMRDQLVLQLQPGSIKKKFPKNELYSRAKLTDLFEPEALKAALKLEATTFETVWFENRDGKFVVQKLPEMVQVAPVQQIASGDFNADGKTDLLLIGNDYSAEVETGIMDASNGALLLGGDAGRFRFVPNTRSGLWADKEARRMAFLKTKGSGTLIIVANNNDVIQAFSIDF